MSSLCTRAPPPHCSGAGEEEEEDDEEGGALIDPLFVRTYRAALAKALVAAPSHAAVTECALAAVQCGLLIPPPRPAEACPKVSGTPARPCVISGSHSSTHLAGAAL